MIARMTGRLERIADGTAIVALSDGLCYELLIAACDVERLTRRVGQEVVLHTIHYVEGDASHGQMAPRLIGFLSEGDRDFFKAFTKVKGIGVRTALQALVRSAAEIAAAIQSKDAKLLNALPGIGARTAERIIADLHGKVDAFAGEAAPTAEAQLPEPAIEAVEVLVQLGERRADAVALVERVLAVAGEADSAETIIQHCYRIKAGRP